MNVRLPSCVTRSFVKKGVGSLGRTKQIDVDRPREQFRHRVRDHACSVRNSRPMSKPVRHDRRASIQFVRSDAFQRFADLRAMPRLASRIGYDAYVSIACVVSDKRKAVIGEYRPRLNGDPCSNGRCHSSNPEDRTRPFAVDKCTRSPGRFPQLLYARKYRYTRFILDRFPFGGSIPGKPADLHPG